MKTTATNYDENTNATEENGFGKTSYAFPKDFVLSGLRQNFIHLFIRLYADKMMRPDNDFIFPLKHVIHQQGPDEITFNFALNDDRFAGSAPALRAYQQAQEGFFLTLTAISQHKGYEGFVEANEPQDGHITIHGQDILFRLIEDVLESSSVVFDIDNTDKAFEALGHRDKISEKYDLNDCFWIVADNVKQDKYGYMLFLQSILPHHQGAQITRSVNLGNSNCLPFPMRDLWVLLLKEKEAGNRRAQLVCH